MGKFFTLENNNCNLTVKNIHCLSLDLTLDCGQSFRWQKNAAGHWCAVVSGTKDGKRIFKFGELSQDPNTGYITFYNCSVDEFYKFWVPYFDLERNYDTILNTYKATGDKSLNAAIDKYYGIRITNQDPWETLCSFIISQNNNIPRIKGIIERLCETYGERVRLVPVVDENGLKYDKEFFTFPSAEDIAKLGEDDLAPIRAGFRNKYIIDAAQKVASGKIDLEKLKKLPLAEAEAELLKITGVGPKVAQCALLYGCGQIDAFPVDTWVKKIMEELYPNGLPECTTGTRGIAQQYLFHWRRNI